MFVKTQIIREEFCQFNTLVECIFRLLINVGDKFNETYQTQEFNFTQYLNYTCSLLDNPHSKRERVSL
jgi:hypothetical protein